MSSIPVLVGVGQFTERLEHEDYKGLSPVELAAEAARQAIADSGAPGIAEAIDVIATTRTFEDSGPGPAPFGKSNNFPRSIAKRLGVTPAMAWWEKAGGDSPQHLVNTFAEKLARGEARAVLLAGAEAISTVRHLRAEKQSRQWAEAIEGQVDDQGWGMKGLFTRDLATHRLMTAPPVYALCENARRARLGQSRQQYALSMGELFAPFTKVASANPYSASAQTPASAEQLATPGERNRMIADPYPLKLVSRDQVNQGAAVLLTTDEQARALGIPESKWVYLHGYAELNERDLLQRADLGAYPAAVKASRAALGAAGIGVNDVAFFDFYSCFPIAVSSVAIDGLGLSADDPRGLTVTGGLPYFGGPGNNYSMHAIAAMTEKLRRRPGSYGFVGANGGFLSRYAAGVYSTKPAPWKTCDSAPLQQRLDAVSAPARAANPSGWATVETYTVVYSKGEPAYVAVIGRLENGARFIANTFDGDTETVGEFLSDDPIGRRICVSSLPAGNRVTFTEERMRALHPPREPRLRPSYEFCKVERDGHLLEVTINRPEARNALHPPANEELAEIFDAFFADPDLWVAILTGAGSESFCAGNDLKWTASGKPLLLPKTGFAGLTSRRDRSKPVIAAVNGFAMGGGFEIALACDLIVADASAQFALSEVKVGLIAGAGGLVRLPRQMPKKVALEYILTGRRMTADDAWKWGVINRIAPAGEALAGARALAAEILEGSPTSVRLSLKSVNRAEAIGDPVEAIDSNEDVLDELLGSEDMHEGPLAFAQKRRPQWKNR